MVLVVEQHLVADLIPYAANSRTHSDAQVAQIAASIREFGWTNPILIDGDGTIIAGHGRLLAARKLGIEEVPCIVLDHLSKAQQRALVIADNKIAANAGWDEAILTEQLLELENADFDLSSIGFDKAELEDLLGDVYTPVYTPSFGDNTISPKDMERAANNMINQIDDLKADKAKQATEVMCPYCAETFQYSGG